MVARHRPKAPVIAVSPNLESLRQLQLVRGVTSILSNYATTMDEQLDNSTQAAKRARLIRNGDLVVITAGMPIGATGTTNMLKVRTVADICFSGEGVGTKTAEGKIRIILQDSDWENLPEHAIIVAKHTDDSMLPHLHDVKGIITEQAGPSSHAAVIGRKLDIPVVINILDATVLFEDDQTVTLESKTGRISYGSSTSK